MDADRFITAQDPVWSDVIAELCAGQKRSHWMWFVFPQIAGLGRSPTAQYYALAGAEAARAYAAHPILGDRLRQALDAAMGCGQSDPVAIFGQVDAMKLRSSLTLFALSAGDPAPYRAGLAHFFNGVKDDATRSLLGGSENPPEVR